MSEQAKPSLPRRLAARAGVALCCFALRGAPASSEAQDMLAYLARREAGHAKVAARGFDSSERARWLARECAVIAGDLRAGMHHGLAELTFGQVHGEQGDD